MPNPDRPPLLSVVVPVHDEAEVLDTLAERLRACFGEAEDLRFEAVLVDDGSTDDSWRLMQAIHARDPRFRLVRLSRNFGHQAAITAGLDHARGDATAVMDADLQDPPETILEMFAAWRDGAEVVYGRRETREGETWLKLATARGFYWLMRKLSDSPTPDNAGDFYLLSRRARERLLAMREQHRYLRGMVFWMGFERRGIPYRRAKRAAGRTKFNLRRMVLFALDGILSSSKAPLYLASYVGLGAAGFGALLALGAVGVRLFNPAAEVGWASLMVTILFLGGVQLATIGILGLYVGRIYDETKRRPLYLVRETAPGADEEAAA